MEEKKKSPNRQKKEQIVAKLSDKVNRAKGLVFTNYQGLTHKQLEDLKKKLKIANAELTVTKNTLLKLALEKVAKVEKVEQVEKGPSTSPTSSTFSTLLSDPTATLFLYSDPIEPLKQLAHTIKELNLPTVKFGIIEGQALDSEQVLKLATLPPYGVLISQLLYQMKMPLYGLHRALIWNLQKLVLTLKAVKQKK